MKLNIQLILSLYKSRKTAIPEKYRKVTYFNSVTVVVKSP